MPDPKIEQANLDANFMIEACYESQRGCERQRKSMAAQRETMAQTRERQTEWQQKQARKDEELYESLK